MRILFSILAIIYFSSIFGQDFRFRSISPDNGLSQGTVLCMLQDKNGFVWIGTDDGLNHFDGYNFQIFKYNPDLSGSISDNTIYDLAEDNAGNIWIATSYGLNKYNQVKGVFEHYIKDTSNTNCIIDNQVRCLAFDSISNKLYVGSDLGNLICFDFNSGSKTSVIVPWSSEEDKNLVKIRSLFMDKSGTLWIGTNGLGLYSLQIKKNRFNKFYKNLDNEERELLKNKITAIYEDDKNNLWIGTDGAHLSMLNKNTLELTDLGASFKTSALKRKGKIRDIIQEKNGTIWVATYEGLLKIKDSNTLNNYIKAEETVDYSLNSNRLLSLMIDNSGSLWIGNYEKGIDILNNTKPWFGILNKTNNDGLALNSNFALSFCEDALHNLYIGTYDGLNYFNRGTNKVTPITHPEIKKGVLSIHVDAKGVVWLGTWGTGLIAYYPKSGKAKSFTKNDNNNSISNNTVLSIFQDPIQCNILWIGTFDGLNKFDKTTETFSVISKDEGLLSNIIYHISGKADTLWVGTRDGGLAIINSATGKIKNYTQNKTNPSSISNNAVLHVANVDSVLYVATKRGLNVFNKKTEKFSSYNEMDGLANSNIWAIIPDEIGQLWITSNGGLSVYNPKTKNNANQFRNFSVIDGIQGNEFNQGAYFYSEFHKEIFVGGINGVNYFNPNDIKESTFLPSINITSMKLFDVETKLDTQIHLKRNIILPYNENFISFEFTSLDYSAPEKILYAIKMDGLDKNWSIPSNRRFASYPDLKPGNYRFRVRATNSQGLWNEEGTTLAISIKPPFWQTTWFVSISVILIITGIILFIRWREERLQRENRILEDTVADRTLELRKKNHDITSSIQYAKRIQEAIILPNIEEFSRNFADSFVLFKPKDIVSGDFFWYTKIKDLNIYAVADCTGHGVPGAFMSIIGNNLLDKIVNEAGITSPNKILDRLKSDLVKSLNQGEGGSSDTKDGMDIAIISIKDNSRTVNYSGAYRPLIRISQGELIKYQADKISIGGVSNLDKRFTNNTVELLEGDCIYAFSDGYPDQFGGPSNKKFLLKRLNNLLLKLNDRSMIEQDMAFDEAIVSWMGNYSQIDDILLVGIRL